MTHQQLRKCIDAFWVACANRETCEGCTFKHICDDLDTSLESTMAGLDNDIRAHAELVEHLKMVKHLADTYK